MISLYTMFEAGPIHSFELTKKQAKENEDAIKAGSKKPKGKIGAHLKKNWHKYLAVGATAAAGANYIKGRKLSGQTNLNNERLSDHYKVLNQHAENLTKLQHKTTPKATMDDFKKMGGVEKT